MNQSVYTVRCDCNSVELVMSGAPKVKAYCHCEDCRSLLQVPYHSVCAWEADNVAVEKGQECMGQFNHPTKTMVRYFCTNCGQSIYNTNKMGWKLISQLLIRKCNQNTLPQELGATTHFFYSERVIDIDDELPKQD